MGGEKYEVIFFAALKNWLKKIKNQKQKRKI